MLCSFSALWAVKRLLLLVFVVFVCFCIVFSVVFPVVMSVVVSVVKTVVMVSVVFLGVSF